MDSEGVLSLTLCRENLFGSRMTMFVNHMHNAYNAEHGDQFTRSVYGIAIVKCQILVVLIIKFSMDNATFYFQINVRDLAKNKIFCGKWHQIKNSTIFFSARLQ